MYKGFMGLGSVLISCDNDACGTSGRAASPIKKCLLVFYNVKTARTWLYAVSHAKKKQTN